MQHPRFKYAKSDDGYVGDLIELDRARATVMITGMIVSTQKAAPVGGRGRRGLLASHHALVRNLRALFRGRVTETAGDGSLAALGGTAGAWHLYATASS